MIGLLIFLLRLLVLPFKPKLRLEAENAALRQQVSILQRKLHGRVQLTNGNRLFFLQLYRWFPREVLAGLVERVTYHNDENGFCVLRIKARGHRDLVTVVGHAAVISAGEWVNGIG